MSSSTLPPRPLPESEDDEAENKDDDVDDEKDGTFERNGFEIDSLRRQLGQ